MPTGFYVRTEEHRKQISKKAIRLGYGKWMKGRVGEKCFNWRGGLPKCKDCGVLLSAYTSKRCHKCFGKLNSGNNNPKTWLGKRGEITPNWKGGLKNNPEYYKNYCRRRYNEDEFYRIRKKAQNLKRYSLGKIETETVQRVYENNIKKYGTLTCYLCLKPVAFRKDHLEHKTPLSRGGTNVFDNLEIACATCNFKKHNRTEKEYLAYADV